MNAKAVGSAQRQLDAGQASLRQAEANDESPDDVNRYKPLAAKDEIPQSYTQRWLAKGRRRRRVASLPLQSPEQAVTKSRQLACSGQLQSGLTRPPDGATLKARAAEAETNGHRVLQQARRAVRDDCGASWRDRGTKIGQPGQNVSPGQQLTTIVPLDSQNIWVTANFETQ